MNCAQGARLLYATNSFFVGLSGYLVGFKQMYVALLIQKIMRSGDLVSMRTKKIAVTCQAVFVIACLVYFAIYLYISLT
jgi:hypothetical protein